jgi:diacylglycerol kinase (ATP)
MVARTRVLAIVNPVAGTTGSVPASELLAACRARVSGLEVVTTEHEGHAIAVVARALSEPRPPRAVVAVGGDGTVRAVAEGMARGLERWPAGGDGRDGEAPALLVLPAGSGNSAYHALWGEGDWEDAVATLSDPARAPVRSVDLIHLREHGRASLLGVNVGLVAAIAARIEQMKGEREPPRGDGDATARYWAALGDAMRTFEPPRVRVIVDGVELRRGPAMLATVGGVRRFGRGAFELLPESLIDDGLLDVCVIDAVPAERVGELAALVPNGTHVREPEVGYARGRTVIVESLDGAPFQIEHDGDPCEAGPRLTLEVVAAAVPALATGGLADRPAPALSGGGRA